jgi:hypothetical protein
MEEASLPWGFICSLIMWGAALTGGILLLTYGECGRVTDIFEDWEPMEPLEEADGADSDES